MVVIALSLTLVGVSLGLALTYWLLVQLRLADLDRDSAFLARTVTSATHAPAYEVPVMIEDYLIQGTGVSAAQVYLDGKLIWEGSLLDAPDPLDAAALADDEMSITRTVGSWRVHTLRQQNLTIQVGRRLTALRATMQPLGFLALPLVVGLSLLSGALAWFLSGRAMRPLEALTSAVGSFDPDVPLPFIQGKDEAAILAKGYAQLLEQVRAQRQQEQAFLAYAAHELRTPISALRASLDVALLNEKPLEPARLRLLYSEALKLETFTQNLLTLARAGTRDLQLERLDLADLLDLAYDRFQPLAIKSGHELVLETQPAHVTADPMLLEQALNNVIGNALRHTPAGVILLQCGETDRAAYLRVVDSGSGIPVGYREGLGYRVIRTVVAAHHAELKLGNEAGAHVTISFPKPPDSAAGGSAPLNIALARA
jgi:two-component system OmpR family sensor kinase